MGLSGVVLSTGQPINRPAVTGRPLSPDALLSLRRANTTLAGAARLRLARRRPGLLDHLAAGVGGDPILDRFLLAIRQGVARATISFPSVMWISLHGLVGGEPVVVTPSRNFSARHLPALLLSVGDADAAADAAALLRPGGGLLPRFNAATSPPDVEMHCLYSAGVPTVRQLLYDSDDIRIRLRAPLPVALTGDGDGTVRHFPYIGGCSRA